MAEIITLILRCEGSLCLPKELAPCVVPALQELVMGRTTEESPTLENIFVEELQGIGTCPGRHWEVCCRAANHQSPNNSLSPGQRLVLGQGSRRTGQTRCMRQQRASEFLLIKEHQSSVIRASAQPDCKYATYLEMRVCRGPAARANSGTEAVQMRSSTTSADCASMARGAEHAVIEMELLGRQGWRR